MVLPSFAQSSSQFDNCPSGTKTEIRGMNIECIPISDIKKTCPSGTYHGLDNEGNFACRDIDTNQIIRPGTEIIYDSQTRKMILDDDQTVYAIIGLIVVIAFVVLIVKATSSKSTSNRRVINPQTAARQSFSELTKRQVMENQNGRCNICYEIPKHWEFDHIHGRGNNSIGNCQGLCRDCHQKKTMDDSRY